MLRTLALAMSTSALIFLNLGKFLAALPALTSLTYSLSWNVLILASSTAAFSSSFNLLNIASGEDTLALRRKSLTALRWRSATSASISSLDLIGTILNLEGSLIFLTGSSCFLRSCNGSFAYSALSFLNLALASLRAFNKSLINSSLVLATALKPGRPRPRSGCARNKVC